MTRTDRVIAGLRRMGWYPAKYAHHPDAIKRAIKYLGFRPQVKQCFANCQRFVVGAARAPDELLMGAKRAQYHEGFIFHGILFTHAWLTLDGEIIDLTLPPDKECRYLDSQTFTVVDILQNVVSTGMWTPIDQRWLGENFTRVWIELGQSYAQEPKANAP